MQERIPNLSEVTIVRKSDRALVDAGQAYYKLLQRADSLHSNQRDLAVVIVKDEAMSVYNTQFYDVIPTLFGGLSGTN